MLNVTKRDGTLEPLDVSKINNWVEWACQGTSINWTELVTSAHVMLYEGIKTSDITRVIIKQCEDKVDETSGDKLVVGARLLLTDLRKRVYGEYAPRPLIDQLWYGTQLGIYDTSPEYSLIDNYSYEELVALDDIIDHSRDELLPYGGLVQLMDKYLVQDRSTGQIHETPQFLFMFIAMTAALSLPEGEKRIAMAERIYNSLSMGKNNLPTPTAAGMRTPLRQYASCCLIDFDDNMKSLGLSDYASFIYTGARAGLGENFGRIRREGSKIRHGEVKHTGLIPFLKKASATSKSCTQNGVRGGGLTANYPLWHYDSPELIQLRNIKGEEATRVRTIDYCVHINGFLIERLKKKQNITLFSPQQVPDLYEAFYADQEKFAELYSKYEVLPGIDRRTVPALDLFSRLATERLETGRIYVMFTDHANDHSSFLDTVYMTNLCVEITLPTTPIQAAFEVEPYDKQNPTEGSGEIALCVLGGIPWGNIELDEMEEVCMTQLILLDKIFDIQEYNTVASAKALKRRSVAVGVIDYAHFLAKRGLPYGSPEALAITHEWMEAMQYYLIKGAVQLAKEKGACDWFNRTKYSLGILPIDTYAKNVDKICATSLKLDWESLRRDVMTYGMRFSTLTGHMPAESSSVTWGFTNGLEPPKKPITVKSSKTGDIVTIIPEATDHIFDYTYAYDNAYGKGVDNDAYLKTMAVIQKFSDQSISYNQYFDYSKTPNIPMSELLKHFFIKPHSVGIKTLYYANSNVEDAEYNCVGGGCSV